MESSSKKQPRWKKQTPENHPRTVSVTAAIEIDGTSELDCTSLLERFKALSPSKTPPSSSNLSRSSSSLTRQVSNELKDESSEATRSEVLSGVIAYLDVKL